MSSSSRTERVRFQTKFRQTINDVDAVPNYSETNTSSSVIVDNTFSNSGADLSKWRAIIDAGGSATNPVTASRTVATRTPFEASIRIKRKRVQGNPPGRIVYREEFTEHSKCYNSLVAPTAGTHIPEASADAVRAFVREVNNRLSPMQMGVAFGELNETLGLIRRPGQAIVSRMRTYLTQVKRDLRRNKHVSKRKKNEIVANTWLEYAFGWTPLINDAKDAGIAAAKVAAGIPNLLVRKRGTAEKSVTGNRLALGMSPAGSITFDITTKTSTKCYVYGKIRHDLGQPGDFPTAFGLTPSNILPTVWELVPWSFAVDYFTGVGDFISSMSFPTSSLQYYARSRLTRVRVATSNFAISGDPKEESLNLSVTTSYSPGQSAVYRDTFTRDANPSLLYLPQWQLPAAKTAYVNLAALIKLRLNH